MARNRRTVNNNNTPQKHKNTSSSTNKHKNSSNTIHITELREIAAQVTAAESSKTAELRSFNLNKEVSVVPEITVTNETEWKTVGAKAGTPLEPRVKIETEDVQGELEFWSSSVFCFVLGANPPNHVMDGYVRRIWKDFSIDKVAYLANGICIVRFSKQEDKDAVLQSEQLFFDNKPFIIKDWQPDVKCVKDKPDLVRIWVRLYNLDFKFWGKALPKIVSMIGIPIRPDRATEKKEYLEYARFMVEVKLGQSLPDKIEFIDEKDIVRSRRFPMNGNPWKRAAEVRKKPAQKVWRPKAQVPVKPADVPVQVAPVQCEEPVQETVVLPQCTPPVMVTPIPFRGNEMATPVSLVHRMSRLGRGSSQGGPTVLEVIQQSLRQRFWNVRGLNKWNKKGDIRRFLHINKVSLFGLVETRVKIKNNDRIQARFSSPWKVIDNSEVKDSGRIWLLWDSSQIMVSCIRKDLQVIHAQVTNLVNGFDWTCSLVYGCNADSDRVALWESLIAMKANVLGPWLVMGDFNNVLYANERIGSQVTDAEIKGFQNCVDVCGLYDLVSTGAYFTWNNKQEGDARVYSRIDRVLANEEWILNGPSGNVTFLPEGLYDHSPCLIELGEDIERRKGPFKYFNMWGKHAEFKNIVMETWKQPVHGCYMFQLVKKLKYLKHPLKKLNNGSYGDIENSAMVAKLLLESIRKQLHNDPRNVQLQAEERVAADSYKKLDDARILFLAQKAKVQWVNLADDNTRYFHSTIKARRALIKS
ncbi:uncharacterized protein LOC141601364 [Silene latifolia]|uniref:uncharacterized protein LOC141601364 n=1 Tax=Silene latifolia TaxID=37657 RepID=UPI003D782C73